MSVLHQISESLGGIALAMGAAVVLFIVVTLVNLVFRYTRADIGQYSFTQRGGWQTFFVKNFDSVCYASADKREDILLIDVEAEALEQVTVCAGPSCRRAPERLPSGAVRIAFAEVPADASFAIRAKADGREITLSIPRESPLQSRSFDRQLPAMTALRKVGRYLVRYLLGMVALVGVFLLGVHWQSDELAAADYALIGTGVLLSVFSFWLVASHEGKSIVAGYVGWGDTGRSWHRDRSAGTPRDPRPQDPRPEDPATTVPEVQLAS
jgi:hypothetical protein